MSFFPLNDTPYEAKDLRVWFVGRSNGIINYTGDDYGLKSSGGMNVTLKPGFAYMATGTDEPGGGMCYDLLSKSFTVEVADDFTRYDYIALEYNETTNRGEPKYYKGNREMPTPVRNSTTFQLIVAVIKVNANAAAITDSDIIDVRMQEKYCGLAIDKLAKIPTDGYDRQFQAFMKQVKGILAGDVAGNLLNLINANAAAITTKQNKILDGTGQPSDGLGNDGDIYLEWE